jgi:CBS domain-containing protein
VVVAGDDGAPKGVLTETDVVRRVIAADRHPWATTVDTVMSTPITTADEACPIEAAGRLMADRGIRHLGVTREGRFIGWVTATSLIAAARVAPIPVRDAMAKLIATIHLRETVREAADRMLESAVGLLLVGGRRTRHRPGSLHGAGHDDLAGLVTESDLVRRVMAADRYPYVTAVGDVMTTRWVTASGDDPLAAVADILVRQNIRHVLVTEGVEVVGVMSIRDLLGAISAPDMAASGGKEVTAS